MCLIHQKKIVAPDALSKKAFETDIWIKDIVVVTDDMIDPGCDIQTVLKRTDPSIFCPAQNAIPIHHIFFLQNVIDGIVDTVKMPFCVRTVVRVAGSLLQKTHLILGCDHDRLSLIALFFHQKKGIVCHDTGRIFGSQIKDLVSHILPHRLYGRKDGSQSLARPCRCL